MSKILDETEFELLGQRSEGRNWSLAHPADGQALGERVAKPAIVKSLWPFFVAMGEEVISLHIEP